ncbi:sigma factor [Streptomyces canus]|uniref:sigma factor n=1 Tax=Streptomyces canus TaxID=58343 RepID=UPI003F4C839E
MVSLVRNWKLNTFTAANASSQGRQGQLLTALVSEHVKALLAYAEKLLNDRHAAEDIVQEALIRAWPHAERLHSTKGSLRGWLLTVTPARSAHVDLLREGARTDRGTPPERPSTCHRPAHPAARVP